MADSDFLSGYVIVQGEPGVGKTALMGELVKRNGYVHHFNVAPLGLKSAKSFLSNVCAQLIVRFGLDFRSLPPQATEDGGFLSSLLTDIAAQGAVPLVIVVDALDEAEDVDVSADVNRLFLPPALPEHVYFVVSTRPEAGFRLFVDSRTDIFIADDDPQNLEDVRSYVRSFIEQHHAKLIPQIETWGVDEGEFVDILTSKSEGNFMYLVHVLRDIRSGRTNASTIDDIRKLPTGLRAYYDRHWTSMKSMDEKRFKRYEQPVVCLLATVREPVSLADLIVWTQTYWKRVGWDPRELDTIAIKEVLEDWSEFLNSENTDDDKRYRVYHVSFADYLQDKVGLAEYHSTISDAAISKIPGFLDQ